MQEPLYRILHENEDGFKKVANLLEQPIWMSDEAGNTIWYNRSWSKATGIYNGVIKPEDWQKYTPIEDLDELRRAFRRSRETKQPFEAVFAQTDEKGNKRWFVTKADPVLDEKGRAVRWLGVNTEITEQKKTEHELLIAQERYQMAALASKDVVWDWNLLTDRVDWSEAMRESLKHDLPDLETHIYWWVERIHPEEQKRVTDSIIRAIENKSSEWHEEYRFRRGDGKYAFVDDRGYIVFDEGGTPLRMVGVMADVTWQRKAMNQLKAAKKTAEYANAAKTAFLANVSHEVRTPLTTILGYVELMKAGGVDHANYQNFLGIIDRNANQILRLLDDVLDLAKVESSNLEIRKTGFSTEQVLEDVCVAMEKRALEKGIEFKTKLSGGVPPHLCSDPVRIKQIITNLVGNAIKFTESGYVMLEISYENPMLQISVSDTGPGIPPNLQESIFEPFKQGDPELIRKYGGSGLGLALTKKLCETMGGSIKLISSHPGKGSVFFAEVAAQVFEHQAAGEKVEKEHPLAGKKILVVDDSPEIRMLVQKLLGRTGASVDVAEGGRRCVEMARENYYDVILLDIQMPGIDGYETLAMLKKEGIETPVCALTAHAMKQDRERALRGGFSSFVTKPMKVDQVVGTIKELSPLS